MRTVRSERTAAYLHSADIYTGQMDPRIRTRIVTVVLLTLIALVVIGSVLKH
jgi:hypothetical protein